MTLNVAPARRGITPAGTTFSLAGRGEPVVLIHGVGMRQDAWAPQIEFLAQTHQVLVYDMLGHGGSPLPPREAKLGDYAAQLAELLSHLDLGAANVAGHSMGALVALEFALSRPARTLRLAALNAVYKRSPDQRAAVQERAAQLAAGSAQTSNSAAIARWFGEPVPAHLQGYAQAVLGYLEAANPQGYARSYQLFASGDEAHAGRLPQLAMPVLYATGELDANSSPAMSQAMALVTPGAEVQVLSGARHMMNLTDAPRVNELLAHWLRRPLA
jgi:pimeloyl-ACP methyl ester carboxylesterase